MESWNRSSVSRECGSLEEEEEEKGVEEGEEEEEEELGVWVLVTTRGAH